MVFNSMCRSHTCTCTSVLCSSVRSYPLTLTSFAGLIPHTEESLSCVSDVQGRRGGRDLTVHRCSSQTPGKGSESDRRIMEWPAEYL